MRARQSVRVVKGGILFLVSPEGGGVSPQLVSLAHCLAQPQPYPRSRPLFPGPPSDSPLPPDKHSREPGRFGILLKPDALRSLRREGVRGGGGRGAAVVGVPCREGRGRARGGGEGGSPGGV